MDDRDIKPENITEAERWHSRHQRHEELPVHIQAETAEHIAAGRMVFVARGSGRMHDQDGDAIEEGEWRIDAWPAAPLNGPEAFLQLSYPWEDDIAHSSTMDSLGGIALDLASCERLAEAATHAAAVLRAGQWVPRPAPIGLQSLVDEAIANAVANGYDVLAGDLRSVAVDIMDHAPAVQEMVEGGTLPGDDAGVGMVAAAVLRARMERTGWRRVAEELEVLEASAEDLDVARQRIADLEAELAREREQVRIARAQCARAQAERDATWAALRQAVATHAAEMLQSESQEEHRKKLLRDADGIREDLHRQIDEAEGIATQLVGDRDEALQRVQELETATTLRKAVPHVTAQSVLDAGINVFGLQLVLESLGEGAIMFDLTYRGRLWRVMFDSTIGAAAGEEPA
jgi:hypothetical protein